MKEQTFSGYSKLITEIIKSRYKIYTVDEYINDKPQNGAVILRHDVDVNAQQALKLARLEKGLGIKSTYYFRCIPKVYNESIMKSIREMGFEVGYHYETLDKSYGDFPKAIQLFKDELQSFRKVIPVKTVCAHGNVVRNKHYSGSNYDIFQFDPNLLVECSLSAEAYLTMHAPPLVYISDSIERTKNFRSVDELIGEIELSDNKDMSYYMLFHPCLWANGTINSFQISTKKIIYHNLTKALELFRKKARSSQKIRTKEKQCTSDF